MPGGNKKGGGLESSPVYKMKGFSGFGNSPVLQTKEGKNLLKAVPNKEAYNKLSDQDKKGFDKAAKEAGLPTKKASIAKKTGKRKLKKLDKKVEKRNFKKSKERLSKLSTEELMKMREKRKSS